VKEDLANGRFQCLVALGRFHCLVALERFHAWWALKGCMLGGLWKVPLLGGKTPFPLSPFSFQQILLKPSFFPLILRLYFTLVVGRYLRISFLFLDL